MTTTGRTTVVGIFEHRAEAERAVEQLKHTGFDAELVPFAEPAAEPLLDMLADLGLPKEEADYIEAEFNAGRTLVAVHADGKYLEATDALRHLGAYGIDNPHMKDYVTGAQDAVKAEEHTRKDKDEWE